MAVQEQATRRIAIVIPVFQDWDSFLRLVPALDAALAGIATSVGISVRVLAVDDGSIDPGPADSPAWSGLRTIAAIDVLRMSVNLGHQRAIALGAVHAIDADLGDAVVVMDADGEDKPEDVPALVAAHLENPSKIILARRARRSEGPSFRAGYRLYRAAFRVLAGQSLPFGNFSLVPLPILRRLTCSSDMWNHFAAAVTRSRQPLVLVDCVRGERYAGVSRMNGVSLIIHGLSAMSVHSDRIAARMILASSLAVAASLIAAAVVVTIRFATDWAIPGWASQVVGTLGLASLFSTGFAALLAFITLQSRQGIAFVPSADGGRYILKVDTWHPKPSTTTSERN